MRIRFDGKESACKAIVEVNGTEVGGYIVRCSWGKESNDNNNAAIPNYTPQVQQLLLFNAILQQRYKLITLFYKLPFKFTEKV